MINDLFMNILKSLTKIQSARGAYLTQMFRQFESELRLESVIIPPIDKKCHKLHARRNKERVVERLPAGFNGPPARCTRYIVDRVGLEIRCAMVERWKTLWRYRESFQIFELRDWYAFVFSLCEKAQRWYGIHSLAGDASPGTRGFDTVRALEILASTD
jgi:hypothetical protein